MTGVDTLDCTLKTIARNRTVSLQPVYLTISVRLVSTL